MDQGFRIEVTDSIQFVFDEQTIHPSQSLGLFQYLSEENSVAYLNHRNEFAHRKSKRSSYYRGIQFFDFSSGKISLSVPLKRSGRNRVISDIQYFYAGSPDSIWVYPSQFGKDLGMSMPIGLFNNKGEVEMRLPLRRDGMPVPKLTGMGGITQRGGELIMSSWIHWTENRMRAPFTRLKIKNGNIDFIDYKPIPYRDIPFYLTKGSRSTPGTSWNDFNDLAEVSSVINVHNELVSSFPLEHRLSILKADGRVTRKKVQSVFLDDFPVIQTMIKKSQELRANTRGSGRYLGLLYDSENELYYRIVRMAVADITPLYSRTYMPSYTYSVMIIDKDFNLLTEKQFESKDYLFEKGLFAAKGGLFVLKNDMLPDRMTFHKLTLVNPL